jgi:hypothetical protein
VQAPAWVMLKTVPLIEIDALRMKAPELASTLNPIVPGPVPDPPDTMSTHG